MFHKNILIFLLMTLWAILPTKYINAQNNYTNENTKEMQKLEALLRTLTEKIPQYNTKNTNVSQASVGWQIEHILLVVNSIIDTTMKSDAAMYQYNFKLIRTVVMTTGKIPRGKGKAPARVVPRDAYDADALQIHLKNTLEKVQTITQIQKNQYFTHPYFGNLNKKSAIKFITIHTQHHINIINDILK